jgi:hypothetical protein
MSKRGHGRGRTPPTHFTARDESPQSGSFGPPQGRSPPAGGALHGGRGHTGWASAEAVGAALEVGAALAGAVSAGADVTWKPDPSSTCSGCRASEGAVGLPLASGCGVAMGLGAVHPRARNAVITSSQRMGARTGALPRVTHGSNRARRGGASEQAPSPRLLRAQSRAYAWPAERRAEMGSVPRRSGLAHDCNFTLVHARLRQCAP